MKVEYRHYKDKGPRTTGRGIVIHDGNILLIERWRDGRHYYSIPGGGVEEDETTVQTAKRELYEETTIDVNVGQLLYEMHDSSGHLHYIYLCEYVSGEPKMPADADEMSAGPDNLFKPCWMPVSEVEDLPFKYWEPIHKLLTEDLKNGFSKKVKITAV